MIRTIVTCCYMNHYSWSRKLYQSAVTAWRKKLLMCLRADHGLFTVGPRQGQLLTVSAHYIWQPMWITQQFSAKYTVEKCLIAMHVSTRLKWNMLHRLMETFQAYNLTSHHCHSPNTFHLFTSQLISDIRNLWTWPSLSARPHDSCSIIVFQLLEHCTAKEPKWIHGHSIVWWIHSLQTYFRKFESSVPRRVEITTELRLFWY